MPTNLGVADHRFIRAHSCRASLRHQTPPSVEKVRRHAMPPCHRISLLRIKGGIAVRWRGGKRNPPATHFPLKLYSNCVKIHDQDAETAPKLICLIQATVHVIRRTASREWLAP
jgi:hypothetical protein